MANGVKRFQKHGGQFIPIVREVGQEDIDARTALAIHTSATLRRAAPQAPNNRFIGANSTSGVRAAGSQPLRGGTSNPISNSKFV